jgi:CheY-like chemotaxis protein
MKKCLVIDDVEVTQFTVEQIIGSLGMESLAVATKEEAIDALRKNKFDIILLDWHLRKASGIDLLKEIKGTVGSRAKLVIFSGIEGADKEKEALQAGADAFLEKPTTQEKVETCLKKLGVL